MDSPLERQTFWLSSGRAVAFTYRASIALLDDRLATFARFSRVQRLDTKGMRLRPLPPAPDAPVASDGVEPWGLAQVGPAPKRPRMIVVTNRIPVAQGHHIDFEDRFKRRAHLVDRAPGFLRNEVHRPRPMKFDHPTGAFVDDPDAQGFYEVKTWWRNIDDFTAWTKSPAFAQAHADRAPKEMFAGASVLEIHEVFLSTDLNDSAPGV